VENLKEFNEQVKNLVVGTMVKFDHYRAGFFYYNVKAKDGNTYQFFVPREDIGNGTINAKDKASGFMKWIRQALKENTLVQLD